MNSLCPCGLNQKLDNCCGPIIAGDNQANSPEQLLRSRYVAYSTGNIKYIEKTMKGSAAKDFNAESAKIWAESITWLSLDVKRSFLDPKDPTKGYAEFSVHFKDQVGKVQRIHEISEFTQIDGQWFYTNEKTPAKSNNSIYNKMGRNELCHCGSGKKYKKCCL